MDDTWTKLRRNMIEIQNHRAANLSYEENHRFAYNMVLHKHGEPLYKGTCQLIAENLEKLATQELVPTFPSGASGDSMQQSQEAETFLKAIRKVWDDHTSSLSKLRDVLKYMVRVMLSHIACSLLHVSLSFRIVCTRRLLECQKSGTQVFYFLSSTSFDHRYKTIS